MPDGYIDVFSKMDLVLTEKLDGQNNSLNRYGAYARSHSAPTQHPWDKEMINLWNSIKNDLGDLELFGESMYAVHSIEYRKLDSYFYLFGLRQNGVWLSWEEVCFWAKMFDLPTAPQIELNKDFSLHSIKGLLSVNKENGALSKWLDYNLGMRWEDYTETGGALGGFDPITGNSCCEGLVIRNKNEYRVNEGLLPVGKNEFDSVFKLVRIKHVKTDIHWTKNWRRAKLKWEWKS